MTRTTAENPPAVREGSERRQERRSAFRVGAIVSVIGFFAIIALAFAGLLDGHVAGAAGGLAIAVAATLLFGGIAWFIRHLRRPRS